jgi:hypothetical protein
MSEETASPAQLSKCRAPRSARCVVSQNADLGSTAVERLVSQPSGPIDVRGYRTQKNGSWVPTLSSPSRSRMACRRHVKQEPQPAAQEQK